MNKISSIAVFCGSGIGNNPLYKEHARQLGTWMAKNDITLIYGGASIGMMGAVADAVLENGGKVIGVIPSFLDQKEIVHHQLTELVRVDSMHERKVKMYDMSDAIVAIPGGFGTMDELFETLTWVQLGLHAKPVGVLNTDGFYTHLLHQMDHMVEKGFVRAMDRNRIVVAEEVDAFIHGLLTIDVKQHVPVITHGQE